MTTKDDILNSISGAKTESNAVDTALRNYLKSASNVVMSIAKASASADKASKPYLAISSSLVQSGSVYVPSIDGVNFLEQVEYLLTLVNPKQVQISDRLKARIQAFNE